MFNEIERDVLGENCLSGFNQWCLIVRKTPSKFLGEFMGEIFCSKEECVWIGTEGVNELNKQKYKQARIAWILI